MVIVKATKDSEAGTMPSEKLLTDMGKYNEELVKAGVMLAGEGLHPSSRGVRVRFSGPRRTVIDGPFTETKELIAGFWLWQTKSLEEAIEWLKRCPNPHEEDCEVEIRPVFEPADFGEAMTPELREQEDRLRAETEKRLASGPAAPKQIFVNLPVRDLRRSVEFFKKLGYTFNQQFTDENATCMIVAENIFVMLLVEKYFKTFTPKAVADAKKQHGSARRRSPRSLGKPWTTSWGRRSPPVHAGTKSLRITGSCTPGVSRISTDTSGSTCGWTPRTCRNRSAGMRVGGRKKPGP
jgi:hypothetical protein